MTGQGTGWPLPVASEGCGLTGSGSISGVLCRDSGQRSPFLRWDAVDDSSVVALRFLLRLSCFVGRPCSTPAWRASSFPLWVGSLLWSRTGLSVPVIRAGDTGKSRFLGIRLTAAVPIPFQDPARAVPIGPDLLQFHSNRRRAGHSGAWRSGEVRTPRVRPARRQREAGSSVCQSRSGEGGGCWNRIRTQLYVRLEFGCPCSVGSVFVTPSNQPLTWCVLGRPHQGSLGAQRPPLGTRGDEVRSSRVGLPSPVRCPQ